jgi:hypothetical protein
LPLPEPVPGLVIGYSYLWRDEHRRGGEDGTKDRPCAIILISQDCDDDRHVTVLPITHTPPVDPRVAVELLAATKRRLGMDEARSWVVLTEANRFIWPGPDLRPVRRGGDRGFAYGQLPHALFEEIRTKFIAAIRARRATLVPRTE